MSRSPQETMVELARLSGEAVEALVEQEVEMLHLVQAEMDALGNLILAKPGKPRPDAARDDIEDSFDNMPV